MIAEAQIKLDWEPRLRRYGKDMHMSLGEVATFLSHRPSLTVACQIIGAAPEEAYGLAKWLDRHGYNVPPARSPEDYSLGVPQSEKQGAARLLDAEWARQMTEYVALKGFNLRFSAAETQKFERLWKRGISAYEIADRLKREPVEIGALALSLGYDGAIEQRRSGLEGR